MSADPFIALLSEYREAIKPFCSSVFVQCHQDLIRYLHGDGTAALVFSKLLNSFKLKMRNRLDRKRLKRFDLWFRFPVKKLREFFNMGQDRMRTALQTLIDTKLIERSYRRRRAMWVRINKETLIDIATKISPKPLPKPPSKNPKKILVNGNPTHYNSSERESHALERLVNGNPTHSYKNNLSNNKKNLSVARQAGNGVRNGFVSNDEPQLETKLASQLERILIKHRKKMSKVNLKSWSAEFRELLKERSEDEITSALQWFDDHIGDRYTPMFRSAAKFCREFCRIEDAMERSEKGYDKEDGIDHSVEEMSDFGEGKGWRYAEWPGAKEHYDDEGVDDPPWAKELVEKTKRRKQREASQCE